MIQLAIPALNFCFFHYWADASLQLGAEARGEVISVV
jgi:hypothetical protein